MLQQAPLKSSTTTFSSFAGPPQPDAFEERLDNNAKELMQGEEVEHELAELVPDEDGSPIPGNASAKATSSVEPSSKDFAHEDNTIATTCTMECIQEVTTEHLEQSQDVIQAKTNTSTRLMTSSSAEQFLNSSDDDTKIVAKTTTAKLNPVRSLQESMRSLLVTDRDVSPVKMAPATMTLSFSLGPLIKPSDDEPDISLATKTNEDVHANVTQRNGTLVSDSRQEFSQEETLLQESLVDTQKPVNNSNFDSTLVTVSVPEVRDKNGRLIKPKLKNNDIKWLDSLKEQIHIHKLPDNLSAADIIKEIQQLLDDKTFNSHKKRLFMVYCSAYGNQITKPKEDESGDVMYGGDGSTLDVMKIMTLLRDHPVLKGVFIVLIFNMCNGSIELSCEDLKESGHYIQECDHIPSIEFPNMLVLFLSKRGCKAPDSSLFAELLVKYYPDLLEYFENMDEIMIRKRLADIGEEFQLHDLLEHIMHNDSCFTEAKRVQNINNPDGGVSELQRNNLLPQPLPNIISERLNPWNPHVQIQLSANQSMICSDSAPNTRLPNPSKTSIEADASYVPSNALQSGTRATIPSRQHLETVSSQRHPTDTTTDVVDAPSCDPSPTTKDNAEANTAEDQLSFVT